MNRRQIELHCESDDGTKVFASLDDWSADGGVPETHVILRTTGGRPVHVRMADGRELAAWLIEHCIDLPDEVPEPEHVEADVRICTTPECLDYRKPVSMGHGCVVPAARLGGVAYAGVGGTGGMGAHGGQGGAGGSATIVQRSV